MTILETGFGIAAKDESSEARRSNGDVVGSGKKLSRWRKKDGGTSSGRFCASDDIFGRGT